ncbi:MAG TPA: hypothetical protein VHL79_16200 [Ramlibacter sp.]|jgi:hypothetical protein|nr:hypothetical protein [Ramlibacter sp.]
MFCNCQIHRRGLFRFGAGLAVAAALGRAGTAAGQAAAASGTQLPARGDVLLRGGHVLTMDEALGDRQRPGPFSRCRSSARPWKARACSGRWPTRSTAPAAS